MQYQFIFVCWKQVFGLEYDLDLFNVVAVPDFNMCVSVHFAFVSILLTLDDFC